MSKINLAVFNNFVKSGNFGGLLLAASVLCSLAIANTGWGEPFREMLDSKLGYESSHIHLNYSLSMWINDGLMAVFFLLVGLEIKRELAEGELSSARKAMLPVLSAAGGALVPALIYLCFNAGTDNASGWGIPMATDIAFALAVISLLDSRIPSSLKIFLAALAIVDDLIAILVIAFFYSEGIDFHYLGMAGIGILILFIFNRLNVTRLYAYIIPGLFIWYFIHHSGIHATLAGVIVAMTVPTNESDKESPLEKLEHLLMNPVNFIIIPIFALANTNISISEGMLGGLASPLGLGISLGLLIGKPIGIVATSHICSKLKIGELPAGAGISHMAGLGLLAGIGFTMSIFISMLSFKDGSLIDEAKFAILVTSLVAGTVGYSILRIAGHRT